MSDVRGVCARLPGLGVAALAAALAAGAAALAAPLSPLPVALLLGVAAGNLVTLPGSVGPGLEIAGRGVLQVGVALLGLRLVLGDLAALGLGGLALVVAVSVTTFVGVVLLARWLRLPADLGLLTAAGFAICGASAVAASQGVLQADEEDVAAALGNVMLFGTLSVAALPLVAGLLGLSDPIAGAWIGAAVHDVGQAVATAGVVSGTALEAAVVVKLGRVLLLGPLVIALGIHARRSGRGVEGARPPLVPWFVAAFLAAALIRTLDLLPGPVIEGAAVAERAAFAAALFALGTRVRLASLRALGPRPLAMGAAAWLLIATLALVGVQRLLG